MPAFSRRLIYALSNKVRTGVSGLWKKNTDDTPEGKLVVDFAKTQKSPFDIKTESSYNAYLSKTAAGNTGSLTLGLKKSNCIAWIEIPDFEYRDHVIEAKIRIDNLGGYASTGIIFHIMDQYSYYLALVSSKGYFRLDAVKDNAPKTLIAWTEISDFNGTNISLNIITYGINMIFLVNGKWVGETNNDSINSGRLGFALASYEAAEADGALGENDYTCIACLDYFSVDTRSKTIEDQHKKWTDDSNINAEGRLRLAETFAVMGEHFKALDQINRAWKRRSDAIRTVTASDTDVRTKKELLLAARMSFSLGQYSEAEEFIDSILEQWPASAEGKIAHAEKVKALNELNKFAELKEFVLKHPDILEKDIDYYTMLARCYWELKEYKESAEAWADAFRLDSAGANNGVYAANAANALELSGKKKEALSFFLEAGKIFLKQDNQAELAVIMPKLAVIGSKNWEARVLAGKWAFSIEDYSRCEAEFDAANKIRNTLKPRPKADPAHYYLWGLVLNLKGKNKEAVRLIDRAVKLAPDYGLFRFKLAEIKLTSGVKDPNLVRELKLALKLAGDDMAEEMASHAGNLLLNAGDAKNAKYFFDIIKKKQG